MAEVGPNPRYDSDVGRAEFERTVVKSLYPKALERIATLEGSLRYIIRLTTRDAGTAFGLGALDFIRDVAEDAVVEKEKSGG